MKYRHKSKKHPQTFQMCWIHAIANSTLQSSKSLLPWTYSGIKNQIQNFTIIVHVPSFMSNWEWKRDSLMRFCHYQAVYFGPSILQLAFFRWFQLMNLYSAFELWIRILDSLWVSDKEKRNKFIKLCNKLRRSRTLKSRSCLRFFFMTRALKSCDKFGSSRLKFYLVKNRIRDIIVGFFQFSSWSRKYSDSISN